MSRKPTLGDNIAIAKLQVAPDAGKRSSESDFDSGKRSERRDPITPGTVARSPDVCLLAAAVSRLVEKACREMHVQSPCSGHG
jgi:hypothetical protein